MLSVNNCLDRADVGLPHSVRDAMGVRNVRSENNSITANAAFCHDDVPPFDSMIALG